ncbi:MAG: NAD(P) transhydrogenase subunit alpha [Chloroflexi bacterium]|nr:MAG: NAD(P) transhydrogenase subunit alpha [Chloroflexota bacterium]
MKVAIPKEIVANERRVALVPQAVGRLIAAGAEVLVEAGAGASAHFSDAQYEEAGARVVAGPAELFGSADVVVKVQGPVMNEALGKHEVDLLSPGTTLISFLYALNNPELVKRLVEAKVTSFSMDAMPRIARAQSMDALSSQATISGYKAVLIAASALGKMMPMMITAAGTLAPSRGFVLGAGVAGLQAIGTARRLGAVMEAFDVRPAVKEQVESLGAKFVELELETEEVEDTGGYAKELSEETHRREQELLADRVSVADFVITTAAVPGRPAPVLITEDMVKQMRGGSVIVDLAAEMGGNCGLTKAGEEVVIHDVTIHGPVNLPSSMPVHASEMYSRNIATLLNHLTKEGQLQLDFEDSITGGCCITHEGSILHEATQAAVG